MISPYQAALEELRIQRGIIDQAIVSLEILSGERARMLGLPAAVIEAPAAAAPAKATPFRKTAVKRLAAAPVRVVSSGNVDDDVVLKVLRELGPSKKGDVVVKSKLPELRVTKAKGRLERKGLIVVTGMARAARWALAGKPAKEAP